MATRDIKEMKLLQVSVLLYRAVHMFNRMPRGDRASRYSWDCHSEQLEDAMSRSKCEHCALPFQPCVYQLWMAAGKLQVEGSELDALQRCEH
jgi:hypothetical protein